MKKIEPSSDELIKTNPKKELHDAKRNARKKIVEKQKKESLNDDVHPKEFAKALINETKKSEILNQVKKLNPKPDQTEISSILKKIPKNEVLLKSIVLGKISERVGLKISELDKLYNNIHRPPKVKNNITEKKVSIKQQIDKFKKQYPSSDYLEYDNKIIEISDSKITLFIPSKINNKYFPIIICNFNLKIISKSYDDRQDWWCYTFTANKRTFYNYSVMKFIKNYEGEIIKKSLGIEIIKFIFGKKGKSVPTKKVKYNLGFTKNGWILSHEDKYSIIWYTDEQKRVLNRCKKIYKKYDTEEKEKIKEKMKELIEKTQMPKEYKTIIFCWGIISTFKLYFIKKYRLFPHLILCGEQHTGKTDVADSATTDVIKQYKEHHDGVTVNRLATFEDMASTSTFAVMIDEFNEYEKRIASAMREMAVSLPDYIRKNSPETQIRKQKTVPIIATSNELAEYFSQPENSSRAIILDFQKSIKVDIDWMNLKNNLKEEKRFSFIYDYTKNWKYKDFDDLIKEQNIVAKVDKKINEIEKANNGIGDVDVSYPRIRIIFLILMTGQYLYKEIFGYTFPLKNVFTTLIRARRDVNRELLERFVEFCKQSKNYNNYDDFEMRKPIYLTTDLKWNQRDGYNFQQTHLGGFNNYLRMFGLKPYKSLATLCRELREALKNKDLVRYLNRKVGKEKKQTKVIVISSDLIGLATPTEPKDM